MANCLLRRHEPTYSTRGGSVVPRRATPEFCRIHGCPISVSMGRDGLIVWHGDDFMRVPENHRVDLDHDMWGLDVKPWLEERHVRTPETEKTGIESKDGTSNTGTASDPESEESRKEVRKQSFHL